MTRRAYAIAATASALALAGLLHAQAGSPPPGPPPMAASKDPMTVPAGRYTIDLEHSSVVARVPHRGMSISTVRFGVNHGELDWNAADPAGIKLNVVVDTKPYYAPIVYKILPESAGFLNVAQFPQASFISTAVKPTGGNEADINGNLTLMGVTKTAVIHAKFVGAAKSMDGVSVAGFTGTMTFNWGDFATSPMAKMAGQITLVLDAEFQKS